MEVSEQDLRERHRKAIDGLLSSASGQSQPEAQPEGQAQDQPGTGGVPGEPLEGDAGGVQEKEAGGTQTGIDRESKEFKDAVHALRRYQYPEDVIEGLDPQRIVEMGRRAKKAQDDQQRVYNQYNQWKDNFEKHQAELSTGQPESKAKPAFDLKPDPTLLSKLQETYGEEAAESISAVLSDYGKTVAASVAQSIESVQNESINDLRGQLDSMKAAYWENQFQMACSDCSHDIPQLRDPVVRKRVYDKASGLIANGSDTYRGEDGGIELSELVRDASALVLRKETIDDMQRRISNRYQKESSGVMKTESTGSASPAVVTPRDAYGMARDMLNKGMDPQEISRRLRSLSLTG
ncbi:MAG: hypothetical protein OEM40_01915 [Acidimicrobiia bacterium]|nr:hypothetical protein [Acidimicrobiia bacterium]